MHDSVLDAWHRFSTPMEGRVRYLYADILGLLTTGVGNLADPVSLALQFPWRMPDGSRASQDEIARQWRGVKAQSDYLAKRHHKYAEDASTMRLSDEDIDAIVADKLAANARYISGWFPGFDDLSADAQLGILSMAWAVGPAFNTKFPTFTREALAGKWHAAAATCKIREEGNPGVVPRNRANRLCFENAAFVAEHGLDRSTLHWPNRAADTIVIPPKPEDDPPLSRPSTNRPPTMADALDIAREATRQARDAHIAADDEFPDREADTQNDPPRQA